MSQTTINVRMDSEIKEQADILFKDLGMNLSTAVNIFVRQAVRQGKIPFEISAAPSATTIAAIEDVENNRNIVGPFNSVDEMMRSLDVED